MIRILLTLLLISSCTRQPQASDQPQEHKQPAPKVDTSAPVPARTSSTYITMLPPVEGSELRFRLTAPAGHSLFLDNCNGAFGWGLEHRVNGNWKPAWIAMINQCHSAPIEILPGSSREFTGAIALQPGEQIEQDTYRLALYGLYSRHDQAEHHRNPEVPPSMRVSEPFLFSLQQQP